MDAKATANQQTESSRAENEAAANERAAAAAVKTAATTKKSTDERNFRTSYYSKVGLGNDEEKIDALLNPPDIDKIKMYIKTYSIPDMHRLKIWKLLLGMTTTTGDDEYTSGLRKVSYDNLLKCLKFLGNLDDQTPPVERNVCIYKFESDKLFHPKNYVPQTDENLTKISKSIVHSFSKVTPEDLFHIYSSFVNLVSSYQYLYGQLVEEVLHMVEKEDVDYENFLRKSQAIDLIKTLFSRCLAGVLDSNLTIRLFDKVVAGYFRLLLPKIVYYLLMAEKHHLVNGDFSSLLNIIPKDKLDPRILSLI